MEIILFWRKIFMIVTFLFIGALYKSSGGLKKAGIGGAFGLGLAALWSFAIRKNDNLSDYV